MVKSVLNSPYTFIVLGALNFVLNIDSIVGVISGALFMTLGVWDLWEQKRGK